MAQTLLDNQIDNLAIVVADAAGNPITAAFDSPPTWTVAGGGSVTASDDGTTAILTPGAAGETDTLSVTAVIDGTTFTASLDIVVSAAPPVAASISIVATPAPKP